MNAIYTGINARFDAFVKFAQDSIKDGNENAIARSGGPGLDGRTIRAATNDKVGGLGAFNRSLQNIQANNDTRADFKEALMDILSGFTKGNGGKIPAAILDVIKEKDYGKGRPLTARRIMLIANAINTRYAPKTPVESPVGRVEIPVGYTVSKVADAIKNNDFAGAVNAMKDRYASMGNVYKFDGEVSTKGRALYKELSDACDGLLKDIKEPLDLEGKEVFAEKMTDILNRERNALKEILGAVISPQRTGRRPVMPKTDEDGILKINTFIAKSGMNRLAESKSIKFCTQQMDHMEEFYNGILSALDKIDW